MPSIDFSQAPQWLQWVIAGTAILAAVIGVIQFIRKGWPVLVRFVQTINALADLPKFITDSEDWRERTDKRLDGQDKTLGAIRHEVEYNNGSSVKDAIKRVEDTSTRLESGIKGLYTRADASDLADKALHEEIEQNRPAPTRRRKPPTKKEQQ